MRSSTLALLAAVTLAVTAAAIAVPAPGGVELPKPKLGPRFPGIATWIGNAKRVIVLGAEGEAQLDRSAGGIWHLHNKWEYPVRPGAVQSILDTLVRMHEVQAKTAQYDLFSRLDVNDPGPGSHSHVINVIDQSGNHDIALVVGRRRYDPIDGENDGIYVRDPGAQRAWLVRPAFDLPEDILGWLDRTVLDIAPDRVKSIVLAPAGEPAGLASPAPHPDGARPTAAGKRVSTTPAEAAVPLILTRAKPSDHLAPAGLPAGAKLKSDDPAADLLASFQYYDFADVMRAGGLAATPVGRVTLTTFDGLTVNLTVLLANGLSWVEVHADEATAPTGAVAKEARSINLRTEGWAYLTDPARAKSFETRLADLMAPEAKDGEAK